MPGTIRVSPGFREIPLMPVLRCLSAASISECVMKELEAQYFRMTCGRSSPLATTCSTVPGGAVAGGASLTGGATTADAAAGLVVGGWLALPGVRSLAENFMAASTKKATAA